MKIVGTDQSIYFGKVGSESADWRAVDTENEDDPDDEELPETPPDVIALLGFDPKDL